MKTKEILKRLLKQGFSKGQIRKLSLSGSNLSGANLSGANLSGSNLSGANLSRADLRGADLSRAYLSRAYLSGANLSGANLSGANLSGADLSGANLSGADLSGANLSGADLSGADLSGADLSWADLSWADLSRAYLSRAYLSGADLSSVIINENTFGMTINCPEEGAFIAFKKASGLIVVLEIQAYAKRSSATSYKCRASAARVLRIENLDGTLSGETEVTSDQDSEFIYKIGEVASVKDFDNNRWDECSTGIHFFMSREMAVNY